MPFDSQEYPTVARKMQAAFDNGKAWGKGSYNIVRMDHEGHCLIGMMAHVTGDHRVKIASEETFLGTTLAKAVVAAGGHDYKACPVGEIKQHGDTVVQWNDDAERTWDEVNSVLDAMHDMEVAALVGSA